MPRLSRLASSALALALLIVPLVAYLMVDDGRLARMGFSLHAPRWSLLLASPTMIQIHVAAAVMALAIGVVLLIGVKGNQLHRTLGWAWVLAMGTTAISSFFIHQLNPKGPGGLSLIHLLSGWTVVGLPMAVHAVLRLLSGRMALGNPMWPMLFVGPLVNSHPRIYVAKSQKT